MSRLNGTAPQDLDAERAVLGAVLLAGGELLERVTATGLEAGDFYHDRHGAIYAAMRARLERGGTVDLVTVTDELRRTDALATVGGPAAVDELAACPPVTGHAADYARIVRGHAQARRRITAARRILDNPADNTAAAALARELEPDTVAGPTSWAPVDLDELVNGQDTDEPPRLLERSDGIALLYPGKLHTLSGEPEAGKGWLALYATAERLRRDEHVLYIDFEDTPATLVSRLLALGVHGPVIAAGLIYLRPEEPLDGYATTALDAALARQPTLAIVDGVTEALAVQGLDLRDNGDVARWLTLVPRRITRAGIPTVLLDHVVKDKENRGRYAIGAQHKLAGVDVAYTLEVVEPFGRGRAGTSRLVVKKDRPGHVRQHGDQAQRVAELKLTGHDDGTVTATLDPPATGAGGTFRPTFLMEKISRALEGAPGLSKRAIRDTVNGKNDAKDLALELLIAEDHIRAERDGQAIRHYVLEPYREPDDEPPPCPRAPTVPQPCPGTVQSDRAPVPPPLRARGTGHTDAGTTNRAPEDDQ